MFDFFYSLCHAFSPDQYRCPRLCWAMGTEYMGTDAPTNQGASLIASLDLLILFWGRKRSYLCEHKLCYIIWPLGQKTICRFFQLILCLYTLLYVHDVVEIAQLESVFPGHSAMSMISRSPASVWVMLWTLMLEFRKETWIGILVLGGESLSYVLNFVVLI